MTAHLNGDTAISCFAVYILHIDEITAAVIALVRIVSPEHKPILRKAYCYTAIWAAKKKKGICAPPSQSSQNNKKGN
jgi:hypothetical protein